MEWEGDHHYDNELVSQVVPLGGELNLSTQIK